jgi:hypothetical protein
MVNADPEGDNRTDQEHENVPEPPQPASVAASANGHDAAATTHKRPWFHQRAWSWICGISFTNKDLSVFDALLTLVAVIGTGFLVDQARQLRRSNDQAVATMKVERRPWVAAIEVEQFEVALDKPVSAGVAITNSGGTPAIDVKSYLVIGDVARPRRVIDLTVDYSNTPYGEYGGSPGISVIYPQMKTHIRHRSIFIATTERINSWRDGSRILYVFGCITYRDIFGDEHASEFCMLFSNEKKGLAWCPVHNDTDCNPNEGR